VSAISLTKVQPVYLRALCEALLGAEQRYGNRPVSELDFDALMEEASGGASPTALPTSVAVNQDGAEKGGRCDAV